MPAGALVMRRLEAGCLTLDDLTEAAAIAERLEELNRERQAIEAAMLEEADAEAAAEMASGDGTRE
jgi:single-stranded-DNA-specific exonuclease